MIMLARVWSFSRLCHKAAAPRSIPIARSHTCGWTLSARGGPAASGLATEPSTSAPTTTVKRSIVFPPNSSPGWATETVEIGWAARSRSRLVGGARRERPFPAPPRANRVNREARHQNREPVTQLLVEIRPRNQDVEEADDR